MYRVLVLLCALNVLVALRRPEVSLRGLGIALVVAGLIAIAVTTLASHTGDHAFLVLPPAIPVLGGSLTVEAVVFGASTGVGIAAAVLSAAPLSLVLLPNSLVDALPSALARTGAAIGTALNLIPGIARSATEIRDAQRMRGWRPTPCPRVAGSRGTGGADRARELDHPRRSDGGAWLRLGSANPLRRRRVAVVRHRGVRGCAGCRGRVRGAPGRGRHR